MNEFTAYYVPIFGSDWDRNTTHIFNRVKLDENVMHVDFNAEENYIKTKTKNGFKFKIYIVHNDGECDNNARKFKHMSEVIRWLSGEYNNFYYDHQETDIIARWIPVIRRIEQNVKNHALYTTVIWEDGSTPTVVKCAQDDPDELYFAVASAIAIRMYGSNSAFKRMIREKFSGLK